MEDTGVWEVKLPEHFGQWLPGDWYSSTRALIRWQRDERVIWGRFSVGCSFFGL